MAAATAVGGVTPLIGCWGLRASCFWHHTCHFYISASLIGASHKGGLQGQNGENMNDFLQAQLSVLLVKVPDWPMSTFLDQWYCFLSHSGEINHAACCPQSPIRKTTLAVQRSSERRRAACRGVCLLIIVFSITSVCCHPCNIYVSLGPPSLPLSGGDFIVNDSECRCLPSSQRSSSTIKLSKKKMKKKIAQNNKICFYVMLRPIYLAHLCVFFEGKKMHMSQCHMRTD